MAGRAVFDPTYLEDIRVLRERGLTLAALARELGMSRSTVCRLLAQAKQD